MATQVTSLENPQEVQVGVSGPDGADRLVLCTGIAPIDQDASAGSKTHTWTWLVGPVLGRAQFLRAIVQGALVRVSQAGSNGRWSLNELDADWDDESGQVEVRAEVEVSAAAASDSVHVQGISYCVMILGVLAPQPASGSPGSTTAALAVTPRSLIFRAVQPAQSVSMSVMITNNGSAATGPLRYGLSGPDAGQFRLQDPQSIIVSPGASRPVAVVFTPTSTGSKSASLQISAEPGGIVVVTLTGNP
jgi:hypothetical protein